MGLDKSGWEFWETNEQRIDRTPLSVWTLESGLPPINPTVLALCLPGKLLHFLLGCNCDVEIFV